ncbi:major facilitator superfamily transporter [Tritrichomonas foetus]|uniref:Major facilitator superfamily transporter n=1 Tax=Tritrichomonas foetus TaxID=1144522 RepID=A0A1J4JQ55_9EUKA|nr:major facilitator superfamily transporter [Tritrichomonas foetus]|eukprot:OHS99651.1 major facilitator superfamily transporter [Tritrichomonas foetus]
MMKIFSRQLLYALIVGLGSFTFGNVVAYPSPTAEEIRKLHNLTMSSLEWSFYSGAMALTAITGPFISGGLLKFFQGSRKKTCFVLSIACTACWLLNIITKLNIWAGIVARALLGFVIGAYSSITPMFLVEVAPEGMTGFYGSLNQFFLITASMLINFLGPSLNFIKLSIYCACYPLLECFLIWLVPEKQAAKYHQFNDVEISPNSSSNANTNNNYINNKQNVSEISNTSQLNDNREFKEVFCQSKNMPLLFIGIFMMIFQQFVGISAVVTNLADLMKESGLNLHHCYQAGIIQSAQLLAGVFSGLFVDKIGRKKMWCISGAIIVIFLLLFVLNNHFDWANILPLIAIYMYEFGFGIGLGPIPWYVIPEYFDYQNRPVAMGICSAVNWSCTFAIIFVWPLMRDGLGMLGSFVFFMSVGFVSFIFGVVFIKEPGKKGERDVSTPMTSELINESFNS